MAGANYSLSNTTYVGAAGIPQNRHGFRCVEQLERLHRGQLALNGGYDDEIQYVRGIAALGFYSEDRTRHVTVAPGDPVSRLTGDPDSNVFSLSEEIGMADDLNAVPMTI
jgi:hypothetical protein